MRKRKWNPETKTMEEVGTYSRPVTKHTGRVRQSFVQTVVRQDENKRSREEKLDAPAHRKSDATKAHAKKASKQENMSRLVASEAHLRGPN